MGAGQGEARLRREALRQQLCLDRLEPVRTGRARPPARSLFCASQREEATHDLRIPAPLPTLFVSAAHFAVLPAHPRAALFSAPGDGFAMGLGRERKKQNIYSFMS